MTTSQDALVFGLNQRSAGARLRARLLDAEGDDAGRLAGLKAAGVAPAVLLSTCERLDIFVTAADAGPVRERLSRLVAGWAEVAEAEVAERAYLLQGEEAVRHLFAVASSLDSEVIGEPQVLGQLKESHRLANAAGMTGPALDRLFEAAYAAAKRVRSETTLAAHPVTIAAAALQVARQVHGDLRRARALISGLGEMAEVMGWQLKEAGIGDLVITHSSESRAGQVARRLGCHYRPWEEFAPALKDADILVATMGSGRYCVTEAMLRTALKQRRRRPIFIRDAAIPGDVEPAAEALDEVFVYSLDDLERVAREGRANRDQAAGPAWALLEQEVAAFLRTRAERAASPTLAALHRHFEAERKRVLAQGRLDAETATRLLIKRLLHDPSERLRQAAAGGGGEAGKLEESLRRLFGLPGAEREAEKARGDDGKERS